MKKIMFLATVVAMALAMAMPTQAQTRKDKKAAAKAQWEMEQQQKREEAELRHQLRMDSIANAQKVAAQKAAADRELEIWKTMAKLDNDANNTKIKADATKYAADRKADSEETESG